MSEETLDIVSLDETTRRQRLATHPDGSAWVSANAGSGKTYVLARRVVRLLLNGADPSKILCLTFTKAAAAEMSGRVYDLLAGWVTSADDQLLKDITEIEGGPPDARKCALARTLFAHALETPGGLKIQTIHAFCESVLHRFPLEAGVPAGFEILDETMAAKLIADAEAAVILEASARPETPLGQAFAELIALASDAVRESAIAELLQNRRKAEAFLAETAGIDAALAELFDAFGIAPDDGEDALCAELPFRGALTEPGAGQLIALLHTGGPNDVKLADRIQAALDAAAEGGATAFDCFCLIFCTSAGAPRSFKSFASRAIKEAHPDLEGLFDVECERIADARNRLAGLRTVRATKALLVYGSAILERFRRAKAVRAALDYDDLIAATVRLLDQAPASSWVQYKLDGGIEHILIDEAQDTSPDQWRIVDALSDDFFSGESARTPARTVFAVGDIKQSIYSFQGADPAGFVDQRQRFAQRVTAVGAGWQPVELQLSFRSTPDVLGAVDKVFDTEEMAAAVAKGDYAPHTANRHADPGRVEVWPLCLPAEQEDPEDWTAPVDSLSAQSPAAQLAARIAAAIRGWLDSGERLDGTGAPIRPGDILVLVRKRDAFVETLTRTLKASQLPVAGADRVALSEHIAVRDLIALAEVALLPENDLDLAAVLRGPLFGMTEQQLFEIAHDRGRRSLREALRSAAGGSAALRAMEDRLATWIGRADTTPPFEFFARVIGADGGRKAFRARLGVEADDILDEFLALTLAYEQATDVANLQGFLKHFAEAAGEIKREPEAERDEIRVMTVHGAKGLEAPVVFLADPGSAPVHRSHLPKLKRFGRGAFRADGLFWGQSKPFVTPLQQAADERSEQDMEAEYRRLLYVGMTRARDRLIVCGYTGKTGANEACWHRLVDNALRPNAEVLTDADGNERALLWLAPGTRTARQPATSASDAGPADDAVLPDWLGSRPPAPAEPLALTPSGATAALFDAEEAGDEPVASPAQAIGSHLAIARGEYIHALLEHLPGRPAGERAGVAERIALKYADLPEGVRAEGLAQVLAILEDAAFAPLFGPDSRAELAIAGDLMKDGGRRVRVNGRIDRLVVTGDTVMIVDFKTGSRRGETVPDDYARQLGIYRLLLSALHPGRLVRAAILWTGEPALQEVPAMQMDACCAGLAAAS